METLVTGMCDLNWTSLDKLQPKIVSAVLHVMFVANELSRSGGEGADGNRQAA